MNYQCIENTEFLPKGYGITITWTRWDGKYKFASLNFIDFHTAWVEALKLAYANGWYPPKWWELWRWRDTRLPEVVK